jgi:ParB family chromosome partitioning protein
MSRRDLSRLADEVFADAHDMPRQDADEDIKRGHREGTRRFSNARIIDLDRIKPDSEQVRKIDEKSEDIAELSRSIKRHGVLQPITVRYDDTVDIFVIITGERRYWASLKAGKKRIPCIIKERLGRDEISFQQMVENLQRENLSPVEEAEGIKKLGEEFKINSKVISEQLGKSESYISRTIRLNDLPKQIKNEIATSQFKHISKEHLIQVVRQNDIEKQMRLWEIIKEGQLNIRQAREIAKKQKVKVVEKKNVEEKKRPSIGTKINEFEIWIKNIDFNEIHSSQTLDLAEYINKLTKALIAVANKLVMLK